MKAWGLAIAVLGLTAQPVWAGEPDANGKEVFHRDWSKHTVQNAESTGADGLGPLYNAVSCVACHDQGGAGGGGANKHNVHLLTVSTTVVKQEEAMVAPDLKKIRETPLHPGLRTTSSVVLHQFSVRADYFPMLRMWHSRPEIDVIGNLTGLESVGITAQAVAALPGLKPGYGYAIAYMRSQRNTPSLFGLGALESISPLSLERVAKYQNARFPEVSGRVAPNGGKFGWRGQTSSVRGFVLGACANELGLQTANFQQPADPAEIMTPEEIQRRRANASKAIDMTDNEITALVSYVEQLPPPAQLRPETASERNDWMQGRKHFVTSRCDACHVKQIGTVEGMFTDLLLHDMGEELNDPAALSNSPGLTAQYYGTGESLLVSDERKQEWRTPPLWGVRDSAPYLHDGRAATIEDAIKAHGGEGAVSKRRFEQLSRAGQRDLVLYVNSLGRSE